MSARVALVLVLACGCSEPLMKNVPQPPASTAAGVGAAAAAAAALATADSDPTGKKAEEAKKAGAPPPRGVASHETMPAGVLDRLEQQPPVDAGVDAAPPAP